MSPELDSTLVFGGTFDPVHRGHIESVSAARRLLGDVDAFLVPCQIPAHRPTPAGRPEDRLRMLELAVIGEDRIFIDDCELKREGTSYTFDTLLSYRRKIGGSRSLIFLMGFDSWITLPTWFRWDELTDLAHLLVLARPGSMRKAPAILQQWCKSRETDVPDELRQVALGKVCFLKLDQINVSASEVRKKIASGESTGLDVSPLVLDYIKQHNLYTGESSGRTTPGKRMES